ncbi:MAG: prolipoprotein diacylglyceryl transferase [Peptococcia bacterium]
MDINPVAFTIGNLEVRWYGLLIAAAFLIGTILALREAKRQGWDEDKFLNVVIAVIPSALIGARLYYVIFKWDYYSRFPKEIFFTRQGGLAIHGGIILGVIVGCLMLRRYKYNLWQGLDIVAPSIILGQAIGRWGNFFNQEAYGYEVSPNDVPWAMYIDGAYRHPTFLYEFIWNLLVFAFLLWLRRRKTIKKGDVFLNYAALYSVGRLFIEGLRTDSLMLGDIRVAQLVSGLTIGAALLIMYLRHRRGSGGPQLENSLTTTANDPDLSKDISPSGNTVLPDDTGSVNDTNQPSSPVASEALNDSSSAKEESEP